ncbi:pilus assembly protein [Pseudonocardia sp. C8]|uniref:TadE/TadG family type IV pilus assembly protein n=1 Tax=Saccharopolyspora cebuensis TaxID=418759 RepID=A0ABV4CN69_9PSEU|nr:pilus assembly protein [Pseudonocardia sp. C8]
MTARPAAIQRVRQVWRRFGGDERGSVTAELVLAVPALLLLLLVIAQFAVWAHATHIAQAAASQALSGARVQGGSSADGQAQAGSVLAQLGGGPLHDPRAAVTRGPEQSTVEITGHAARVVPFLDLPVRARAVGPSERFVPPEANG